MSTVCRSVVGVDISQEAVDFSKDTYEQIANLRFLQGSATEVPLPDNCVDAVVSLRHIEHLTDQVQMMAEIRRVLRPNGFLIISSPNRDIYFRAAGSQEFLSCKRADFPRITRPSWR